MLKSILTISALLSSALAYSADGEPAGERQSHVKTMVWSPANKAKRATIAVRDFNISFKFNHLEKVEPEPEGPENKKEEDSSN